jgi:hypothetical protein
LIVGLPGWLAGWLDADQNPISVVIKGTLKIPQRRIVNKDDETMLVYVLYPLWSVALASG